MSQARSDLLDRLQVLSDCMQDPAVSNGALTDVKKNAIAATLRNGLAVLAFATVESFIRERTGEVLEGLSSAALKFSDLSDKLQKAVTISALQGLLFRAKFQDKIDQVSWVLAALPPIANAEKNVSTLSRYSFGHASSNLDEDVVPAILSAFGVEGGWAAISATAKSVGLGGVLDYAQAFKDLAARRHAAAHDITINVPLNDLKNSLNTILGLCCSFDLLLSHALSLHNISLVPSKARPIRHTDLKLRFISPHPTQVGKYREQVRGASGAGNLRTVKVHLTLPAARTSVLPKTSASREQVVILGSSGIPEQWANW